MRPLSIAAAFALVIAAAGPASAKDWGQIKCDKAKAADERAICGSTDLVQRDAQMSLAYGLLRGLLPMGGRGALVDEQRAWLDRRSACGRNKACIRKAYEDRMADLEKGLDRVAALGPF